jgi:peptidoglycan/xylan/chitin deacetylase (PgdA/CDA1 family)/GT2 family glycosyltransferase
VRFRDFSSQGSVTVRRVSIVIPAHNEEALLSRCLESLLAQDFAGETEILVVNNASTDGTARIARSYGVEVIDEPERGYCRALRIGFAHATSELIACTDADSVVPSDWISRLVAEYDRRPDVVAIGGGIEFTSPNWKSRLLTRAIIPLFNWLDRGNSSGPHLWGANLSVRRAAFLAVGGWNPNFNLQADSELSQRLRKAGRVIIIDSIRVRTSSRRWNKSLIQNSFIYASNWFWLHLFDRPLHREFPVVRDLASDPVRAKRQARRVAVFAAGAMVTLACLVGYAALVPQSSEFGHTYWKGDTQQKLVALTFDDGPNEPCTSRVLDILDREHVHATFFLIGHNVRKFPGSVARIVREGHVVGNHSDTHPFCFALRPVVELRREIDAAEESIHAAGGVYPLLFRPPQGLRSPWLMRVLEADSLVAVTWDDAPRDWDPIPASELVKRTLAQVHAGSIILLHDGMNLTPYANQSETVKALPVIIHRLRAIGYRFCTVPELIGMRPTLSDWPHAVAPPITNRSPRSHTEVRKMALVPTVPRLRPPLSWGCDR